MGVARATVLPCMYVLATRLEYLTRSALRVAGMCYGRTLLQVIGKLAMGAWTFEQFKRCGRERPEGFVSEKL